MTRFRLTTVCAAFFAAVVSFAATSQDAPFIGVVTQGEVEVRSGAGRAYYVVGELKKGDMVRVQKVLFNQTWYQVRVPSEVHSYVSKAFVDAQGDGEKGTINADRTEFKAASLRGPGESYRVQGTLSKGDTVKIISEEGNFYKIASPGEASVFIPAGTLRKATADDLKAAGEEDKEDEPKPTEGEGEKPSTPVDPVPPIDETDTPDTTDTTDPAPPVEPDTTDTPDTVPPVEPDTTDTPDTVPPIEPDTTDTTDTPNPPTVPEEGWPAAPEVQVSTPARSDELKALELKVLPYFSLPVTEQPLDKIAKAYQDLFKTEGLPNIDKKIIEVRLRTVERRQEIYDTLQRAEQAEKIDHARTVVPDENDTEPLPAQYTAVGLLQPSSVYDGKSLPLLYRVVDAAPSGRTLAYVAPSEDVNIAGMLNQLVGIVGDTSYDRALKLNIIEIKRAVMLGAEASAQVPTEESDAE